MRPGFVDGLIFQTIFPIILIGIVISASLSIFLTPPLASLIENRVDRAIVHTTFLAEKECEERFRNILELRMEENEAMNNYSKREALHRIKSYAFNLHNVKVMIIDNNGDIQGASFTLPTSQPDQLKKMLTQFVVTEGSPRTDHLWGEPVRYSHIYFPFWRWHIVSFTPEEEYFAPINMAKRIVYLGTFGTLAVVVISVILMHFLQIMRPLKQIVQATEDIRKGNFRRIGIKGNSEIDRVAITFDEMVQKLETDRTQITKILGDLRESEERYRFLFEQAAIGVSITDTLTGKLLRVNQKYADITGYTIEELSQMSFHEITHPEDLGKDLSNLELLMEGKISEYTMDKRFIHKNGSIIWGRLSVSPLHNFQRENVLHIAILENITQRKVLERKLEENSALLEAVLMQSQIPMTIYTMPERQVLYINQAAIQFMGLSSKRNLSDSLTSMLQQPSFYYVNGSDLVASEVPFEKALNGVQSENQEVRVKGDDGLYRWALFSSTPIFNRKGKQIAAFSVFPEITERKNAEAAIRESEERYRLVMEACPEPIAVYDMQGRTQYVNNAFTRVFGWESAELVGRKIPFVPQEAMKETLEMLEILKRGERHFGFETRRLNKSGNIIDVVISWGVWQDHNGKPAGSVVVLRDVTRKNQLKKQLIQAQKMESIGNLAGGIAHDFNNILQPILGLSQLLQRKLSSNRELSRNIQTIFEAGLRASELVQQILAFSRQSDQEKKLVYLQNILKEVLKLSRSVIPKSIEITQDIYPNCQPIMADPGQIHQAILNLITNAYHAVPESEGVISVTLDELAIEEKNSEKESLPAGNYAILSIADNGTGISHENLDKIFEPYFSTKTKGKGTGLGLSIVYGIIKELQGDIKVHSKVSEGATFQLFIPTTSPDKTIACQPEEEPLPMGSESILLVDDEEPIIGLIKEMLEELGYTVTAFTDSVKACDHFTTDPTYYDLVVTDMTMPKMNGLHLSREIKQYCSSMPIIMCTGFGAQASKARAAEVGIEATLRKPLLVEELAVTVRNVLDMSHKSEVK